MRFLPMHQGAVRALAYSPDGTLVASGGDDNQVQVWELATGRVRTTLDEHSEPVRGLAFSPDGKKLASAGWDDVIRVWQFPSRVSRRLIHDRHDGGAWSVAFSPQGDQLVSGAGDGTVFFAPGQWRSGKQTTARREHTAPVSCIAFGRNGQIMATASHDCTVRLWDPAWMRSRGVVSPGIDWVRAVALSPDGSLLALSGMVPMILLYTTRDLKVHTRLTWHTEPISHLSFAHQGQTLISSSWDGTVTIWEVASERRRDALAWEAGRLCSLAVAPDGMTAAAGGEDGTVVVWDLEV